MPFRHLALQTGPPRVGAIPCPCRPCRPEQFLCLTCQGSSFAVPCRAVLLHFFAFDALPQQIISQPRDAIALQFRGDSWQVSALALHHSAPLALPLLAGAIWYQILTRMSQRVWLPTVRAIFCSCFHDHCLGRQSTALWSYTISTSVCHPAVPVYPTVPFHGSCCPKKHFPAFQKNVPFPAMPLLHGSALCPCPSVLRSAFAIRRISLPSLFCSLLCPC